MLNKLSNSQLLKNMAYHVGKNIIMVGGHKYQGKEGMAIKAEIPKGKNKPAMLIELNSGEKFYVDKAKYLFFIVQKIPLSDVNKN